MCTFAMYGRGLMQPGYRWGLASRYSLHDETIEYLSNNLDMKN